MDDNIFKVISAAIVSFMSYCIYAVKQHSGREASQDKHIHDLQIKASVSEEQLKHILEKMDNIIELANTLKSSNNTILRALARKK